MGSMTPSEIIQLITTVSMALIATLTFFIGRMTVRHGEGKEDGQIVSDMGYVKSGVDDIKRKQEQQEAKEESHHLEVIGRLAGVEESVKSAHKRIDRLEIKRV